MAVGTILNDDVDLTINDITVLEGDSGTTNAVFTVSAIGAGTAPATVNYFTSGDTASRRFRLFARQRAHSRLLLAPPRKRSPCLSSAIC